MSSAVDKLTASVIETQPNSRIITTQTSPDGQSVYIAFACEGAFGEDYLEFLVTDQPSPERSGDPLLVTYRSVARDVKYIYPFQVPITDFGAQEKRLKAVREDLRWPLVGCELIECYE